MVSLGDPVHVTVREGVDSRDLEAAGATVFRANLGDPNAIAKAANGCEVVVHAAGVWDASLDRATLDWVHIAGMQNVVKAAKHAGCERLVVVSCADVSLRLGARMNWTETRGMNERPVGSWARGKLLAEEIALAESNDGFEVTALRPAWVWGAGCPRMERYRDRAQRGEPVLVGDGDVLFATTHLENLVDAIMDATEVTRCVGRAYYVTDGSFLEAREFFSLLSEALRVPGPSSRGGFWPQYLSARVSAWFASHGGCLEEILLHGQHSCYSIQDAIRDLEWRPRLTVEQGMEQLRAR